MNYSLFYTNRAVADLQALPAYLLDEVEARMLRLAESPTTVSEPIASPPFPPRGQLYHFTIDDIGDLLFFTVIFRFSQDETALEVLRIMWREIEPDSIP